MLPLPLQPVPKKAIANQSTLKIATRTRTTHVAILVEEKIKTFPVSRCTINTLEEYSQWDFDCFKEVCTPSKAGLQHVSKLFQTWFLQRIEQRYYWQQFPILDSTFSEGAKSFPSAHIDGS